MNVPNPEHPKNAAGEPGQVLARRSPLEVGVDPQAVERFLDAVAAHGLELHSLMIVVDAAVIAETWWRPYSAQTPHLLYSLSKSFTSVAAGIAESEGLLAVSDRLADHLPELEAYGAVTIADALRMSVGHLVDPVLDPSQKLEFSDEALHQLLVDYAPEREPGEVFTYDQLATFAVAKVIERAAGVSLLEYLRPRLFEPLGASDAKWQGTEAHNPGFSGLALRTETIAAFGQLLLQNGQWHGEQLVPAEYVELATSTRMANDADHRFPPGQPVEPDSALGYGYQFWIGNHGYHAGGAYSQTSMVLPAGNAVVAITASTPAGQVLLDAIYEHLLPAFVSRRSTAREPEVADASLAARLAGAALPAPVSGSAAFAKAQGRAALSMLADAMMLLKPHATSSEWAALAGQSAQANAALAAAVQQLVADPVALVPADSRDVSAIVFRRAAPDPSVPEVRFGGLGGVDLPEIVEVRLIGRELVCACQGETLRLQVESDGWAQASALSDPPVALTVRGGWNVEGILEAEIRMIETPHVGFLTLDPSAETFDFAWREPTLHGRSFSAYQL